MVLQPTVAVGVVVVVVEVGGGMVVVMVQVAMSGGCVRGCKERWWRGGIGLVERRLMIVVMVAIVMLVAMVVLLVGAGGIAMLVLLVRETYATAIHGEYIRAAAGFGQEMLRRTVVAGPTRRGIWRGGRRTNSIASGGSRHPLRQLTGLQQPTPGEGGMGGGRRRGGVIGLRGGGGGKGGGGGGLVVRRLRRFAFLIPVQVQAIAHFRSLVRVSWSIRDLSVRGPLTQSRKVKLVDIAYHGAIVALAPDWQEGSQLITKPHCHLAGIHPDADVVWKSKVRSTDPQVLCNQQQHGVVKLPPLRYLDSSVGLASLRVVHKPVVFVPAVQCDGQCLSELRRHTRFHLI